jgi:hypothetical protein
VHHQFPKSSLKDVAQRHCRPDGDGNGRTSSEIEGLALEMGEQAKGAGIYILA